MVGDLHTIALVALDGTVDFMCFPRFDSPSIFASLLDPEKGGYFKLQPELEGATRNSFTWAPQSDVGIFVQNSSSVPAQAHHDSQFTVSPATPLSPQSRLSVASIKIAVATATAIAVDTIIPNEAAGLAFEYQIGGSSNDDYMNMGIGHASCMSMEAKYVNDLDWNGTPIRQVLKHHGQKVPLVFTLKGVNDPPTGTPSVRNRQSYIPLRPQLRLSLAGSALTVAWPLSAPDWTLEAQSDLTLGTPWQPQTGASDDTDCFRNDVRYLEETKSFFGFGSRMLQGRRDFRRAGLQAASKTGACSRLVERRRVSRSSCAKCICRGKGGLRSGGIKSRRLSRGSIGRCRVPPGSVRVLQRLRIRRVPRAGQLGAGRQTC